MSSVKQRWLIEYLQQGGSLYIEGSDVCSKHQAGGLAEYLGAALVSEGTNRDVYGLTGQDETFVGSLQFDYEGGSNTHRTIDALRASSGELLFACEEGKGRAIANSSGNYRTICSSVILGAFADGEGNNTKAYLMKKYLEFLESQ